jgi:molecular chaperone DnaK (HSP70)
MATFVGIDLGTTNSAVAYKNAYGRPEVIPNREGQNITPSVIYFGTDPPAVGAEAKEWARLGNEEIASFFKPHMGSPLFQLEFHGKFYSATDLSALILRRLKEDAEAHLQEPVDRAVITVPAYFADRERKATLDSGRAAGLDVLRIINEPTAAALAYGLQKKGIDETVLIYDLGGGTFDVTVARITPEEIQILATAGDHDLGGKNWDDRIATHLAEQFAALTGFDPLDDPAALNEILVRSEQAKWTLSDRASTRVNLQLGTDRRSIEITRDDFEAMTFPLMERTRRLTEEALAEANLNWPRLDGVLLVGGSTRMPMVRNYVTQMAGKPPRTGVNVDEVVALGSAIQAAIEVGQSIGDAVPQFTLSARAPATASTQPPQPITQRVIDVMSHSLGTIAVNPEGDAYINDIVIPRNVSIPARESRTYLHHTHGGANTRLEVYLTQGESTRPLDCTVLGKYVFDSIHPTHAEVAIDVALSYDSNGVVQVEAVQRDTKQRLPMSVEPVPDDLSWLALPPVSTTASGQPEQIRVFLLIDVSASMMGIPLEEAQNASREFLARCDFTMAEVGLISFSTMVTLQSAATSNVRRLHAAIHRLEAEGSTNLSDALEMARGQLAATDRKRYIVLLTDGYPDAGESAIEQAMAARGQGIEIVAIGTGDADREYLRRLASSDQGAIFARGGELVQTFGHIARVIAEGGRALRVVP